MKKKNQNVQTEKELRNELNFEVGQRIRSVREALEESQEHFSEKCDISVSFLRELERGTKSPTSFILYKICKASKVSADYILFGDTRIKNPNISAVQELIFELDDPQINQNLFNILKEYLTVITKIKKSFMASNEISSTIEKETSSTQSKANLTAKEEINSTAQNKTNSTTD